MKSDRSCLEGGSGRRRRGGGGGVPTGVWLARSHEEEGAVLVLRDSFTDVCARSNSISIRGGGVGCCSQYVSMRSRDYRWIDEMCLACRKKSSSKTSGHFL